MAVLVAFDDMQHGSPILNRRRWMLTEDGVQPNATHASTGQRTNIGDLARAGRFCFLPGLSPRARLRNACWWGCATKLCNGQGRARFGRRSSERARRQRQREVEAEAEAEAEVSNVTE